MIADELADKIKTLSEIMAKNTVQSEKRLEAIRAELVKIRIGVGLIAVIVMICFAIGIFV